MVNDTTEEGTQGTEQVDVSLFKSSDQDELGNRMQAERHSTNSKRKRRRGHTSTIQLNALLREVHESMSARVEYGVRSKILTAIEQMLVQSKREVESDDLRSVRETLRQKYVTSPKDIFHCVLDERMCHNILRDNHDWLDKPWPLPNSREGSFVISVRKETERARVSVQFTGVGHLNAGVRKMVGVENDEILEVPSLELLALVIPRIGIHSASLRDIHKLLKTRLWVRSRRVIEVLGKCLRNMETKPRPTLDPVDPGHGTCNSAGVRRVFWSSIIACLPEGMQTGTIHNLIDTVGSGQICLVDDYTEHVPPTNHRVVAEIPNPEHETPNAPGVHLGTSSADWVPPPLPSTSTDGSRGYGRCQALVEEFGSAFLHNGIVDKVFGNMVKRPNSREFFKPGFLLKSVVTMDKLSNSHRPTNFIEVALGEKRKGGNTCSVCRALLASVLMRSTFCSDLHRRVKKLKRSSWVEGPTPDWDFGSSLLAPTHHQLSERILGPLGLKAVCVSPLNELCMVRTFAFLLWYAEGRLPPYCWRLTALIALAAIIIRGCPSTGSKARLLHPPARSLEKACLAICGGSGTLLNRCKQVCMVALRGYLDDYPQNAGLAQNLNCELVDVILTFFQKRTREDQQGGEFTLAKGLPYEAMQIFPALTGKAFVVIRTIGDCRDSDGNIDRDLAFIRETSEDTVLVVDVFAIDENGERVVCTYGSYKDAQEGLGSHTPYVAFFTGHNGMSHVDPVIAKDMHEHIESLLRL